MRTTKEQKALTRQKIIDSAGKGFRTDGYGGLGIDGLAKGAGVTSGAFYKHFASKDEAFKAIIEKGLQDYAEAVANYQTKFGEDWYEAFLEYYLGKSHVSDLSCSCAVPGLSAEVMRADEDTKKSYETEINNVAEIISAGLSSHAKEDAWALMALLAGSVIMARCVKDEKTVQQILDSAKKMAESIIL